MKLVLLLAVCLLGAAGARAQSVQDDLATLEKKRAGEVARATENVNRTYLKEYERLLQRANLVNDAQGANLVRTMIRRLSPEPEATPDAKPGADPTALLTGNHWIDETTTEAGRHRVWPKEFLPTGEMIGKALHTSGTWKIVNNELVVEYSSYPNASEKFPLPVHLDKWRGTEAGGNAHFMSVDRTGGDAAAPSGSPGATPAKGPTAVPDYFGR